MLPLDELVEKGVVKKGSLDDLRTHDHLINYFYLPPIEEAGMPESMVLLYSGITDYTTTISRNAGLPSSQKTPRSTSSTSSPP